MPVCILSCVRVHDDLQGPKCGEKYANYASFGSLDLEYSIWSLNIVQNIFNDYLWSYMIETDISAFVLTCYSIFDNFQDKKLMIEIDILLVSSTKKLSKMCQIYRFCPLLNPECPIWSLHIMSRHIQ